MEEEIKEYKARRIIELSPKYSLHIVLMKAKNGYSIAFRIYNNEAEFYSMNKTLMFSIKEAISIKENLEEILGLIEEES